jgi:hypothetical protein
MPGTGRKVGALVGQNQISHNNMACIESQRKRPGEMEFFTPHDLYRRWGKAISLKTMANWRSLGTGPPYSKMGGRVLYRISDVLVWENQHRFITRM